VESALEETVSFLEIAIGGLHRCKRIPVTLVLLNTPPFNARGIPGSKD
jgi:hypothetical protein